MSNRYLKAWLYQNEDYRIVSINTREILQWKSNRTEFAWIDYLVVVDNKINSVEYCWDEV